jgi:PAS domain S-box-containing protein
VGIAVTQDESGSDGRCPVRKPDEVEGQEGSFTRARPQVEPEWDPPKGPPGTGTEAVLLRRIARRLRISGAQDLDDYLSMLEESAPERAALRRELRRTGWNPGDERGEGRDPSSDSDVSRAMNAAPAGILVSDGEGRIELANAWVEEKFGYTREELRGQPVEVLIPEAKRSGHRAHRAAYLVDPEARPMGGNRDLFARRKDGSEFQVEIGLNPVMTADGVRVFAGISDISERKAHEAELESAARSLEASRERYRHLFETSAVAHWEQDLSDLRTAVREILDGGVSDIREHVLTNPNVARDLAKKVRVLNANEEALQLFAIPAGHDLAGALRRILIDPTPGVFAEELAAIAQGDCHFERECEVVTLNGAARTVVFSLRFPPRDASYGSILLSIVDVTERKESEARLRCALKELERSSLDLEQFAYVASHDLQEPLRKLISFSQLLEDDAGDRLPEVARRDLSFIIEASHRMRALIQALLEFGRAGSAELNRTLFPLGTALDRAMESLSDRIRTLGAQIHCDPMPEVRGDEALLSLVFQNLVGNALKFVDELQVPRIRVGSRREGAFWRIEVADNGIGIDPQYHERIFVPFKRLNGRTHYEGSGIGLAICKRIVERHGGAIWVESAMGQGAAVVCLLPATDE